VSKGWIFDLDGTLVDSLPGIAASLNAALAAQGLPVYDAMTVRTFIGDGAEMLVRRALRTADPEFFPRVLQGFREHYAADWSRGTTPYAGIPGLLETLRARGDGLAVLSNKPHAFTMTIVDELFPGVFSQVIGQRAGIPHKPDPTGLWEILEAPGWSAESAVMIGDSVMDLQTAHAAGIGSIAVTWGYHDRGALERENPALVVEQVEELAAFLFEARG
jgi:phosphoglycolate phosphatase